MDYVAEPDLHQGKQESECPGVSAGTRIKEASVKKLKYFSSAVLVLSLLALPATAQKGKDRDNKGATSTGATRADLVKDTNKTPPDNDKNDKNKGKRRGFTIGKGMHKGRH
jgi:hypothetical protein